MRFIQNAARWWALAVLLSVTVAFALVLQVRGSKNRARPISRLAADPSTSCGPVSVAIVGTWLGEARSLEVINRLSNVGESGTTSLLELKKTAQMVGLAAECVMLNRSRSVPWTLPTILHIDGFHFAAALPLPDGQLIIADPPSRPRIVRDINAIGEWDGTALVAAHSEAELKIALASAGISR